MAQAGSRAVAGWQGNMADYPIAATPATAGMAALFADLPLAASAPARAAPSTHIDTIAANAPNLPPLHSPAFGGDSARRHRPVRRPAATASGTHRSANLAVVHDTQRRELRMVSVFST